MKRRDPIDNRARRSATLVAAQSAFIALVALAVTSSEISSAQTRDPRMGHWGQQRGPGSVGLHVTYEDLGDGRFRYTMGAHYMPVNQQIVEGKCDGGTSSAASSLSP